MARNDVFLNINALSPADAVVTGQQDMTAATVPELVLGDTPTFNFYFTDNTNVWPSWAGNASYTLTWALSDAVAGDFAPAATTGNATPITGGWSVILPLNSYDLVGLLNTKRVGQPYPVQNLWQQLRVTDPSGNEVTRAMFWTPVRYRAISDTQNTESASPTGGRFVTVNNVNTLTTPTAAQFYAANPVPTSALGTAANGELLIGNGTGFTKATLTAGSGVSITNGSGSITITATDGDITLDDGTAAAPSLKFTADTDTGLFRPSDNVVGISAGGVSRATFGATSAINGTTIPSSKTLVVTTDKLSALAATTSAELAGVISDETGSGALVFANTPTFVTPNIGAATGTSVNLSGAGTFGGNLTVSGTALLHRNATPLLSVSNYDFSGDYAGASTVGALIGSNSTNASLRIAVLATDTTSDPFVNFLTAGATNWSVGVDNSDSDSFKIANTTGVGSSEKFTLTTAGNATLYGNLTVSGTGTSTFSSEIAANKNASNISFAANGSTPKSGIWTNNDGTMEWSDYATGTHGLSVNMTNGATVVSGNLTVSGTGTSSVAGKLAVGTTAVIGNAQFTLKKATDKNLNIDAAAGAVSGISIYAGTDADAYTGLQVDGDKLYLNTRSGGNVLIGTTTDGGQKLQVSGAASITGNLTVGGQNLNFGGTGNSFNDIRLYDSTATGGTTRIRAEGGGLKLFVYDTLAMTIASDTNATFAGAVTVSGADKVLTVTSSASTPGFTMRQTGGIAANRNWGIVINNSANGDFILRRSTTTSGDPTTAVLTFDSTGNATFAGSIAIGNTVNTVSPTSPNRTITMVIGGTTYYIHAKTTND